jgi:four helix bundle protein
MSNQNRNSDRRDIQQRAFSFACRVVKLYQLLLEQKGAAEVIGRQLLRSGTSIGANLEEASAGQSKCDFAFNCNIALKEARETHYRLRLLVETKIIPAKKLIALMAESNELAAILTTIVKRARIHNKGEDLKSNSSF